MKLTEGISPGSLIVESYKEHIARQLGLVGKEKELFFTGKFVINQHHALMLSKLCGETPDFWIDLHNSYQAYLNEPEPRW